MAYLTGYLQNCTHHPQNRSEHQSAELTSLLQKCSRHSPKLGEPTAQNCYSNEHDVVEDCHVDVCSDTYDCDDMGPGRGRGNAIVGPQMSSGVRKEPGHQDTEDGTHLIAV